MAAFRTLTYVVEAGVALCTLRNPPPNYMTAAMVAELFQVVDLAAADDDVRVLVLTGGLRGVFITHFDVAEIVARLDEPPRPGPLSPLQTLQRRLQTLPKITVAALNGDAMGGGCEMALYCDFRVMADGPYRFGLPELTTGILPGAGGTQMMTRLVGRARALDLILHATIMSPRDALALGLVHRLFPEATFEADARAFARRLAQVAPIAARGVKAAIHQGADADIETGLAVEWTAFQATLASEDARAAMRAFIAGADLPPFKGC